MPRVMAGFGWVGIHSQPGVQTDRKFTRKGSFCQFEGRPGPRLFVHVPVIFSFARGWISTDSLIRCSKSRFCWSLFSFASMSAASVSGSVSSAMTSRKPHSSNWSWIAPHSESRYFRRRPSPSPQRPRCQSGQYRSTDRGFEFLLISSEQINGHRGARYNDPEEFHILQQPP